MPAQDVKWEWRPKRSFVGAAACWVLLAVGLVFVIGGLCFCRDAIERPADEFRYNFVPLFVLVSIGLILMLGGAIGIMCIEISGHAQAIRRLVQHAVGMMSSGITDHAHEMQAAIKDLRAEIENLAPPYANENVGRREEPKKQAAAPDDRPEDASPEENESS